MGCRFGRSAPQSSSSLLSPKAALLQETRGNIWLCMVQDPTCAKVSISGTMAQVPDDGVREAAELLFSRHPQMQGWPKGHDFRIYELQTDAIRLLDFYGGAADISSKDYMAAQLKHNKAQALSSQ